jgi:hypothetical protein
MLMARHSETPTNVEVVTFAVAFLDGLESPVHLEQIAIKAFELSSGAFRWDLDDYANFIDKDKVRVSLTDAEKPSAGSLVKGVGRTKRGGGQKRTDLWRLTAAGSDWVAANADRLSSLLGENVPGLKKSRANQIRRQLIESALYSDYVSNGGVDYSPYNFADLLQCSPDAASEVIRERFDRLRGQVNLLRDEDLDRFLEICGVAHERMLEIQK